MDIGCGCEKTNTSLNLTNQEPDIDKIYLDAKDSYEAKYKLLINKNDCISLKHLKAFVEYSNAPGDIYKKIKEFNPCKNQKILII